MIKLFIGRSARIDYWLERQAQPYLKKHLATKEELENIIHYLESLSSPKKITKVSYEQAKKAMEKWFNRLLQKSSIGVEQSDAVELVFIVGNYSWVKLKTEAAYVREGKLMGHCVASYAKQSQVSIYSLRDPNNEPHCTVEVKDGKILQIKGKANKMVIPKYHSILRSFINKLELPIQSHDAWDYGWLVVGNKMIPEDELPDEVEIAWNNSLIKLSAYAKIPKKMKVHSIKISNQKNLDLSNWQVQARLDLENCDNVILPDRIVKTLDLRMVNVNLNPQYLNKLQNEDLNLSSFVLINSKIAINNLKVNHIADFRQSKIKANELSIPNHLNVESCRIEAENFYLKSFGPDTVNLSDLSLVKKIVVQMIKVDDNVIPEINKIYLHHSSHVEILTTASWAWPKHWSSVFWLKMLKSKMNQINFDNLKEVESVELVGYRLMIGATPRENVRKYLFELNKMEDGFSNEKLKIEKLD